MQNGRINTRNIDNGQENTQSVSSWYKFICRSWNCTPKAELIEQFGHSKEAMKAIDKYFLPFIDGNNVFCKAIESGVTTHIGYIDQCEFDSESFIITLNSEFGNHSETVTGKNKAVTELYNIYTSCQVH